MSFRHTSQFYFKQHLGYEPVIWSVDGESVAISVFIEMYGCIFKKFGVDGNGTDSV